LLVLGLYYIINLNKEFDMSEEQKEDYEIKLTGKSSIIFEIEGGEAISMWLNDKDATMKLLKIMIDSFGGISNVSVSDDGEQAVFKNILGKIE
jgi:hypothetical protein